MLGSWKTTLAGIVPLVFALLVGLGFVDVAPQEASDALGNTIDNLAAFLSSIVGAIGLFSKDADK